MAVFPYERAPEFQTVAAGGKFGFLRSKDRSLRQLLHGMHNPVGAAEGCDLLILLCTY
jgi:hypothetical protein